MEKFNEEDSLVKEYDSKLMKRLLEFAKPYKLHMAVVMLVMLIVTGLDLLNPYLIKNAIDNYITGSSKHYAIVDSNYPGAVKIEKFYVAEGNIDSKNEITILKEDKKYLLLEGKIDTDRFYKLESGKVLQGNKTYNVHQLTREEVKALKSKDISGVARTALYLLLMAVATFGLNYVQIYLLQYTGQKIIFTIRQKLFKHVEGLSLSFFDKNPVGRLVTRVTNDVETLNEMYTSVLIYLFKDIFILVGIAIAMFMLNAKLALVILCSVPFIVAAAVLFKKYDRDAYRDVRVKLAKINSSLSENISGMKTVQIYNKESKKYNEFHKVSKDYFDSSMKQLYVFAIFRPAMDLISSLTLAALLWFGGTKVLGGSLQIGVLFAFVSYLMRFFQPIFDLTEKFDILQSSMASSERIFMLMDNKNSIKNIDAPIKLEEVKGNIEFRNVWFAYNEGEWVLRDVSFNIRPGEKVAFVGATGAGKTSIISLISRLYDIQKGEILLDGINIKHMDKAQLRKKIATVLQDVFLFTGDIKSNIRLNDDSISDENIIKACTYVNADRFIEKLPNKYENQVNERGTTFSQGERQLIAFARAIAFNPPILVLDEATSSIDTETEVLIQDALEKITKDRTTIIVAHRLSTIKHCDKIIVLHKGKIREEGNHEELIQKGGLYFNLYQLQYKEHESSIGKKQA